MDMIICVRHCETGESYWEEGQEEGEAEEKARGGGVRTSRRGREVKRLVWEQWSRWDVGRKRKEEVQKGYTN